MGVKVINEAEVVVSRRGRTASFDSELLDAFESLTPGLALDLSEVFGNVGTKEDRQKVGAEIRRHWAAVRSDKCRIDFGSGSPQVRIRPAKG